MALLSPFLPLKSQIPFIDDPQPPPTLPVGSTAGLIVDCTEGTYNPLVGQDLGVACKNCPEFSTSPVASTSVDDCVCAEGFIQTILADGTAKCECDSGKEIMNGVRCDACQPGTYKPESGNSKCLECRLSPLPLAATEYTTTIMPGSKLPTDCVCKVAHMYLTRTQPLSLQYAQPVPPLSSPLLTSLTLPSLSPILVPGGLLSCS